MTTPTSSTYIGTCGLSTGAAEWSLGPSLVKIIAQGEEFEDGVQQETGHIEIDFGLDSLFRSGGCGAHGGERGEYP